MMKTVSLLIAVLILNFPNLASAACAGTSLSGGVDILPWSVARPFPWDNIQGYWQLGDNNSVYIKAKVTAANSKRKILQLSVLADGLCSKATARGSGYVDANEKNVVRALLADQQYRYQFRMGLFNPSDLTAPAAACSQDVMAVSVQVLGRAGASNEAEAAAPLDPNLTETQNLVLKKVTIDVEEFCQK